MRLMHKSVALAATTAAVAAGLAFGLSGPASAATNYTVSPGGAVTATQTASLVFTDSTSSAHPKLTCTGFSGKGTAVAGGHAFVPATYPGSPTGLDAAGSLSSETLSGCTNPVVGSVTVTPSGTWKLGFSSKSSTGGTGYLFGVSAHVAAASGTCQFDANGAVYGTYANSTGVFTGNTTSGLTITNVTGSSCPAVGIHNNDLANLSGGVKLAPIQTIS